MRIIDLRIARNVRVIAILSIFLSVVACGDSEDPTGVADAEEPDAGAGEGDTTPDVAPDAADSGHGADVPNDTAPRDGGDTAPRDVTSHDASDDPQGDATPVDSGDEDATPVDSGDEDATPVDSGGEDASEEDGFVPDTDGDDVASGDTTSDDTDVADAPAEDAFTGDGGGSPDADPECGNLIVEEGEACDGLPVLLFACGGEAGREGLAGCEEGCALGADRCRGEDRCGDGVIDLDESCDDGANEGGDGCAEDCASETCGDGVADDHEVCDGADLGGLTCGDLGAVGILGCTEDCRLDVTGCGPSTCGNDALDGAEQCDDGNTVSGDGCSVRCVREYCGDGVVQAGIGETCDDGPLNSDERIDACRTDCRPARCGDGVLDTGETCDEGEDNSDTAADACRTTCVWSTCGDGGLDSGEACDDGNRRGRDGCDGLCRVEHPPTGSFVAEPSEGNAPLTVQFRSTTADTDGTVVAVEWDYGDGMQEVAPSPVHVFEAGTWEVTMTAVDNDGLRTPVTGIVRVNHPPTIAASATPTLVSPGSPVQLVAEATDVDGQVVSIVWSPGDGADPLTGASVTHAWATSGTKRVTVVVTDDAGATAQATVEVRVDAPPVAVGAASPLRGIAPLDVTFSSTGSSDPEGGALGMVWEFGDGSTGVGASATRQYIEPGTYPTRLRVTDPMGRSDEVEAGTIEVLARPVAVGEVTPRIVAPGASVTLDGRASTDADGAVVSGRWSWGSETRDGLLSSAVFPTAGVHAISLVVTDDDGIESLPAVYRVVVSSTPPAQKTWLGGMPGSEDVWSSAANWSPTGVPTSSQTVVIPSGSPHTPRLTAAAVAGTVIMHPGSVLDLGTFGLTVSGHLDATTIRGTGMVTMTGTDVWMRGTVPNLTVSGTVDLAGASTIACNLIVQASRRFRVGSNPLDIGCDLSVTIAGTADGFVMDADGADVTVRRHATFTHQYAAGSASSVGDWSRGELKVRGNFTQTTGGGSTTGAMFRSTGTRVVFDGTTEQTVSFTRPDASRFSDVVVRNPVGVLLASEVSTDGRWTVEDGSRLTQASGVTLNTTAHLPEGGAGMRLRSLSVTGVVRAARDAMIPNATLVQVVAGARLEPNGRSVHLTGPLTVTLDGTANSGLVLRNSADRLRVDGTFTATHVYASGSATSVGRLTAGELELRGDFVQTTGGGSTTGAMFGSTGTRVVFAGDAVQQVSFSHPGATTSRFHDVEIRGAGGVRFTSSSWITGRLEHTGTGPVTQSAGDLYFTSRLPRTGATYDVVRNHSAGSVSLDEDVVLPGRCGLTVDPGTTLKLDGRRLRVGGPMLVELSNAQGGLRIQHPADELEVGGTATFTHVYAAGSATGLGALTDGVVRVRGNLVQTTGGGSTTGAMLRSTGTRFVFDGTAEQTVSFSHPGSSRLVDVEIANAAGVVFASDVWIDGRTTLHDEARVRQTAGLTHVTRHLPDATSGWAVPTTRVVGTITMERPVTFPSGRSLRVAEASTLVPDGYPLEIGGSLEVLLSTAGAPGLRMRHPEDDVRVAGSVTFTHVYAAGAATSRGALTSGVLRVGGDFTQTTGGGSTTGEMFRSTGTRLRFEGAGAQRVSFTNPGPSRLWDVEVADGAVVELASTVVIDGLLTVVPGGRLTQSSGETQVTGELPRLGATGPGTLRVTGPVTMYEPVVLPGATTLVVSNGGTLEVAGQSLEVRGAFTNVGMNTGGTGLRMLGRHDRFEVHGTSTFTHEYAAGAATTSGSLLAGTYVVRGNFVQTSGGGSTTGALFRSTGTRVILAGDGRTVSFTHPGPSGFQDLEVAPGASVTFVSTVDVRGSLLIGGSLTNATGQTTSGWESVTLPSGGRMVNNGAFRFRGAFHNLGGAWSGNAPTMF